MITVRIDTHTHLYDSYQLKQWCDSAALNLGLAEGVLGALIVVDREGQDSLARLRREAPSFGEWREGQVSVDDAVAGVGVLQWNNRSLIIVRGVQYVSRERLEVLALGVGRSVPDGAPAAELVELIRQEGGVACLPWSPGKWIGRRGQVISKIMSEACPHTVVFGDIALRSVCGPFSSLLWRARLKGCSIVYGTDPLPQARDCALVGSFGVELSFEEKAPELEHFFSQLVRPALLAGRLRPWGRRNSPLLAIRRFISTL